MQARFFFQQLISGVSYCHSMVSECYNRKYFSMTLVELESNISLLFFLIKQICHRDLKLENTLLDGSPAPRLKICDFGYSKVVILLSYSLLHLFITHVKTPQYLRFSNKFLLF